MVTAINIDGKEYRPGKITASMSRRAMELSVEALDAAAKAEALKTSPDAETAAALMNALMLNIDEKAKLICRAYDNAFTPEQLLDAKGNNELNSLLQGIVRG